MKDRHFIFEIHNHLEDVASVWRTLSDGKDILFEYPFLNTIENFGPAGIRPIYVTVVQDREIIALLYFQLKFVRLAENLRIEEQESCSIMQRAVVPLRNAIIKSIQFQTLVCGNLLVTGSYGFDKTQYSTPEEAFLMVVQAMDAVKIQLEKEGIIVDLMMIKDLAEDLQPKSRTLQKGFTKFKVQPKMLMNLSQNWDTLDDYLSSLKSKYRVRSNKALSLGRPIQRKTLSYDEIVFYRKDIYDLYKNISDQARFNAFLLDQHYFENLKLALKEDIQFTSYWVDERMIAFYTSIFNGDTLNAHFLGYDHSENLKYHLYLNILLDIIKEAISQKMKVIDMSRTAIEIKSSVGAVPHDLYLYIKHSNTIINKSLETLINIINPETNYIIRNPFRF